MEKARGARRGTAVSKPAQVRPGGGEVLEHLQHRAPWVSRT